MFKDESFLFSLNLIYLSLSLKYWPHYVDGINDIRQKDKKKYVNYYILKDSEDKGKNEMARVSRRISKYMEDMWMEENYYNHFHRYPWNKGIGEISRVLSKVKSKGDVASEMRSSFYTLGL